ncbi:MAG: T9SS type A sorting domain-containing protein [Sphingobacteriales bacterium]|nr:T9SS type A sorting domain-containing protein [Sphingobacteriales bacterium]
MKLVFAFLCSLLLGAEQLFAQNDIYFPLLENTKFVYTAGAYDGDQTKELVFDKDTLVDGVVLKKYFFSYKGEWESWESQMCLLLEDVAEQRVWQRYFSVNAAGESEYYDQLLYDFSLQLNDTISYSTYESGDYMVQYISKEDSVMTGNGWAKRLYIRYLHHASNHDHEYTVLWIEGVGNYYNTLSADFPDWWNTFDPVCVWKNNTFVFGNCEENGFNSLNDPMATPQANVFAVLPTLPSDNGLLQLAYTGGGSLVCSVALYDMQGKTIAVWRHQAVDSASSLLSLELPAAMLSGVYVLSIADEKEQKQISNLKIIR